MQKGGKQMEGLTLSQEMSKRGITIADVAKKINKARETTILKIDGIRDFKLNELVALADLLEMSIEETIKVILVDRNDK